MAVAYYNVNGAPGVTGVTSTEIPRTGGKVEVGADGIRVRFYGRRWWTVKNTGKYDNAGTEGAAAYVMFYRYGTSAPNLTYAGAATAADIETLAIEDTEEGYLMPPCNLVNNADPLVWEVFFKPEAAATNGITIQFTPNVGADA
jgi:hypothetical protein